MDKGIGSVLKATMLAGALTVTGSALAGCPGESSTDAGDNGCPTDAGCASCASCAADAGCTADAGCS